MNPFQMFRQHRRLIDRLRQQPKAEISASRRPVMRDQIVLAANAIPSVPFQPEPQRQQPRQFAFATIAAMMIVFVVTSTVIAAQAAGPGDPLFGVDRFVDNTQLAFTLGANHKAAVAANIAEERQAELEKIESEPIANPNVHTEAQANANNALDQAIEAVGKVTTRSEKNQPAITSKAAQKVQHLIDIRARIQAKRVEQEKKKNDASSLESNDSEKSPADISGDSEPGGDDDGDRPNQGSNKD